MEKVFWIFEGVSDGKANANWDKLIECLLLGKSKETNLGVKFDIKLGKMVSFTEQNFDGSFIWTTDCCTLGFFDAMQVGSNAECFKGIKLGRKEERLFGIELDIYVGFDFGITDASKIRLLYRTDASCGEWYCEGVVIGIFDGDIDGIKYELSAKFLRGVILWFIYGLLGEFDWVSVDVGECIDGLNESQLLGSLK